MLSRRNLSLVLLCAYVLFVSRAWPQDETLRISAAATVNVTIEPPEVALFSSWQVLLDKDVEGEWIVDEQAWLPADATVEVTPGQRFAIACKAAPGWANPPIVERVAVGEEALVHSITLRELPSFTTVAEITPQTVLHGEILSFVIEQEATMTFEPHPQLQRNLVLENGIFRYSPSKDEREQFLVTFSSSEVQNIVVFTPVPALSPERSVIEYRGNFPHPESAERKAFFRIHEEYSESAINFNYENQFVRTVTVTAPRLVFEKGHEQALYETLCYTADQLDNDNLERLEIYADQIIVREALRFPGTEVIIHARELVFEDDADAGLVANISTTPVKRERALDQDPNVSKNGESGLPAGNLDLNVQSIIASPLPPYDVPAPVLIDMEEFPEGPFQELTSQGFQLVTRGFGDLQAVRDIGGNKVLVDNKRNDFGAEIVISMVDGSPFYFDSLEFTNLSGQAGSYDIQVRAYPYPFNWGTSRLIHLAPTTTAFQVLTASQLEVKDIELYDLRINIVSRSADFAVDNIVLESASRPSVRFDLGGGEGQDPEKGRDGAPLSNPPARNVVLECCSQTFPEGHIWHDGMDPSWDKRVYRVYWNRPEIALCGADFTEGAATCPRSGVDALGDGGAGKGGSGGVLRAPFLVHDLVNVEPGRNGLKGITRKGSRGDRPLNALEIVRNSRQTFLFTCVWTTWAVRDTCGNRDGLDAAPKDYVGLDPLAGSVLEELDPQAWAHPLTVRSTLEYARSAYLNGYPEVVRDLLEPYEAALEVASKLPENWPDVVDPDTLMALDQAQLRNEISTLLDRVERDLDYFGYPAGWVPMLSFEVTQQLFEDEVKAAGDILYVTWYLEQVAATAENRVNALRRLRNELTAEYDELVKLQPGIQREFDALYARAEVLDTQIRQLGMDLESLEELLLSEGHLTLGIKKALRVSAGVLKAIPFAQTELGFISAGLSAASKFNEQSVFDSVVEGANLASEVMSSNMKQMQTDLKTLVESGNPKVGAALLVAQKIAGTFDKGIATVASTLEEVQSWDEDLEREVEILAVQSPDHIGIVDRIKELNEIKKEFAPDMIELFQRTKVSMERLNQIALALDSLGRESVETFGRIDQEAFRYIREMGQRQRDRLLRYQYYLVKAYQYRTLKPYHLVDDEAFNLQGVFDHFQNHFTSLGGEGHPMSEEAGAEILPRISQGEQKSLTVVFSEQLREVKRSIVRRLQEDPPERTQQITWDLKPHQLAALNGWDDSLPGSPPSDYPLQLNFVDLNVFSPHHENLRIYDLRVVENPADPSEGFRATPRAGHEPSDIIVTIEHSGQSLIDHLGEVYRFTHLRTVQGGHMNWSARYHSTNGSHTNDNRSLASNSLLGSLLEEGDLGDLLLYSRPGAWSDLSISRVTPIDPGGMEITELTLNFSVDYLPREDQAELEIEAVAIDGRELKPLITVRTSDQNGRSDGFGPLRRVYRVGQPVTLEVPAYHGSLVFSHWENFLGDIVGETLSTSVPVPGRYVAIYETGESTFLRGDVTGDGAHDLSDPIASITYQYLGTFQPTCLDAADYDDSGVIDISDPIASLTFQFQGGNPPPPPGTSVCGGDPTVDSLDCESFPICRNDGEP